MKHVSEQLQLQLVEQKQVPVPVPREVSGELITKDDLGSFHVASRLRPLQTTADISQLPVSTITVREAVRLTIEEYEKADKNVRAMGVGLSSVFNVCLNGKLVPEEEWDSTIPSAGSLLTVTYVARNSSCLLYTSPSPRD